MTRSVAPATLARAVADDEAKLKQWIRRFGGRLDAHCFVDRGGQVQMWVERVYLDDDSPWCFWDTGVGRSDECQCFNCAGWPDPDLLVRVRKPCFSAALQAVTEEVERHEAFRALAGA